MAEKSGSLACTAEAHREKRETAQGSGCAQVGGAATSRGGRASRRRKGIGANRKGIGANRKGTGVTASGRYQDAHGRQARQGGAPSGCAQGQAARGGRIAATRRRHLLPRRRRLRRLRLRRLRCAAGCCAATGRREPHSRDGRASPRPERRLGGGGRRAQDGALEAGPKPKSPAPSAHTY